MIADAHALESVEEVRDRLTPDISTDLLRAILRIETAHMFDDQEDVALRELDALINAHLQSVEQT